MKRLVCGAAVVLSIFTAALLAAAQDEKTPTIKDVMKLHKGANAPLGKLGKALKSESPDWKDIQKTTKDFVVLGASLEKHDPPKGEKASWKKFADGYIADAKALDETPNAE